MKNFGILGGGFGLYGYLPAAFNNGFNILTLEKYKDFILSRADIKQFFNKIQFYKKDQEVINKSNILVIARRPGDQQKIIKKLNYNKLVIIEGASWIFYSFTTIFFLKLIIPDCKIIYISHSVESEIRKKFSNKFIYKLTKFLENLVLKFSNYSTTVSIKEKNKI